MDSTSWAALFDRFVGPPMVIVGIAVGAIVVRWLLHRLIKRIVRTATERHAARAAAEGGRTAALLAASGLADERYVQRTETMGAVLRSIVTIAVTTIATLTIMATLNIPLGPLLASAGIGGVAVGFGAQSLVKDFISGVFMIVEDQYGVGDTIDTGEAIGVVEDVSLRVTRLRDRSGVVWYVRNGEIVRIGNHSQGWSTAQVDVPIALTEDLGKVAEILRTAVADLPEHDPRVIEAPNVTTESMSQGAITLRVSAKCLPTQHLDVQRDLRDLIKGALDRGGVQISAPTFGPGPSKGR